MPKGEKDFGSSHNIEIPEQRHRDIVDLTRGQKRVSSEERLRAQNIVNRAKDIVNNFIDRDKTINTIRTELQPYMFSIDSEEKITYYRLKDLENALFDGKNLGITWGQIGAEASYNKILRQSLDTIAYKLDPIKYADNLKIIIRDIFDKNTYTSILNHLNASMGMLDYKNRKGEMKSLIENMKTIYPNSKIVRSKSEKQALIDTFMFIKQERHSEGSRRGIHETSVDQAMDSIMKCIIRKIPKETLQTLRLSVGEATIPTSIGDSVGAREEADLRNALTKIDASAFTNLRRILGQSTLAAEYQWFRDILKPVYDFYQGGTTTLAECKKSLSDLIPVLYEKAEENAIPKLKQDAHSLHSQLVDTIGKQRLRSLGIEDRYLDSYHSPDENSSFDAENDFWDPTGPPQISDKSP